jgi:hypothetical protein
MPAQPASYQVIEEPRSVASDSAGLQPQTDSSQAANPPGETETAPTNVTPSGFEVVLEVANKKRALQRYADLREWGHKVQMSTQDSLTFKLSIPIDAPLSDSIRHRDSLSRFFGRKVWIETH